MLPEPYLRFRHEFIALDPERYPADFIDWQISKGFWRCWGTERAAILAHVETYPSGLKELRGLAAAGDIGEIKALIAEAEEWGRKAGCEWADIDSRPAWVKLLPDYQIDRVRIVKRLI